MERFDAVIAGGGHNGLVAATLLARAGWSVCVLERREQVGGAAVSARLWPGVDARVSRYSYLVSLMPSSLRRELGLGVELRRRRPSSYTPTDDGRGLLLGADPAHGARDRGAPPELAAWETMLAGVARALAPALTEPLRSREELLSLIDAEAREALFEAPLGDALGRRFRDDVLRGVVLTDGLIGTFASAMDPSLRQNRCFLYHVIGDGTGHWDVPVGGMGAISDAIAAAARAAGAQIHVGVEVETIDSDGTSARVGCAGNRSYEARHVLVGAGELSRELTSDRGSDRADADRTDADSPEGAQLKLNMLLTRLPRLRDTAVTPEQAFTGTFHVNESYAQLELAYAEAAAGRIPSLPPCESYCHSLSDPTILGDELRAIGAQTMTVFGLHMPARLFRVPDGDAVKRAAVAATLRSLDAVLAEPIEECLMVGADGEPCLEALTPVELESELGMPGGHIFHRDLQWPFAERDVDAGRWGVETELPNVWICGAAARRGGGVSGIPGHNAARAVLAAG